MWRVLWHGKKGKEVMYVSCMYSWLMRVGTTLFKQEQKNGLEFLHTGCGVVVEG